MWIHRKNIFALASLGCCKGLVKMTIRPFSLSHDWTLYWNRANGRGLTRINSESSKEQRALQALGAIGVIGGSQLSRIFLNHDKNRLKRMVRERKLIRHEIQKNKQLIPVYTLGPSGAKIAQVPKYEENYWVKYKAEDVIKRLLFFQLYERFPKVKIVPAPSPFVGAISFKGNLYHVYVVRGEVQDLLMYLKWHTFTERMIVITESLNHLQPLNAFASELKVRVTTDQDLRDDLQTLFYHWGGCWVKEDQQIVKAAASDG